MKFLLPKTICAFLVSTFFLTSCGGDNNASAPKTETPADDKPAREVRQSGDWAIVFTPESDTVAPGTIYEGTVIIQNLTEGVQPEFFSSGRIFASGDDGGAHFSVLAESGFEKGKKEKEQKFSIQVKIPMANGEVATKVYEGKFIVKQTGLFATPNTSQPLFTLVANTITLDAPELGDQFKPQASVVGGDLIPSPLSAKQVIVVPAPQSKRVVMKVRYNKNGLMVELGEVAWESIDPPAPEFKLIVNGREYDGRSSIPKKGTAVLKIVPDKEFQTQFAKDARYMMTAANIKSGNKSLTRQSGSGKDATKGVEVDLSALKDLNAGDDVTFEIIGLKRINFQNKPVELLGEYKISAKVK